MPFSSGPISVKSYRGTGTAVVGPPGKAFVQGATNQNGAASSATVAKALNNPVGNGNALCILVSGIGMTGDNITISDEKGNSSAGGQYVGPVDTAHDANSNYNGFTFYALNLTNGPQTITATDNTSARTFMSIMIDEFSGLSAINGHNLQAQSNPGTGTDAVSSGTYTTTQNGNLIWGAAISIDSSTGMSIGTGFTVAGMNNVSNSFTSEYMIQTSASATTAATFTDAAATDETMCGSLAFS